MDNQHIRVLLNRLLDGGKTGVYGDRYPTHLRAPLYLQAIESAPVVWNIANRQIVVQIRNEFVCVQHGCFSN